MKASRTTTVLAEQHLLDRADESVEVRGEPRRLLGGHRHRCSSLIDSSTGRSRPRPQHPTRPVRRPWRSGSGTSSPTAAARRSAAAVDAAAERRRQPGVVGGRRPRPGLGRLVPHAAREREREGRRRRRRHDRRPRTAAPPHGAAAHLEPRGSPNGRLSRVRSHPVPRNVGRLADLGAVGVDRDDLQARAATGVDPGDVAVPGLLVHPRHVALHAGHRAGCGSHDDARDLGVRAGARLKPQTTKE